jgi:uncharacterized membrane protein
MKAPSIRLSVDQIKNILQKPEQTFLIIAAVFGLLIVFTMPLFMAPDETVHFDRAYEVGSGHLLSKTIHGQTGDVVPIIPGVRYIDNKYIPPIPRHDYFSKTIAAHPKFIPFPSSALYSPVAYLPQAVGVDVGRVVYPSVGIMVLTGRIFNLAAYIFMIWLAICMARQGKWVYAAAGLLPVGLQEAASLSTDVMTIGLCFLTIAFVHNLFLQKEALSKRQYLALLGLAIGLGLTKQTNIVLLLSVLFLPREVLGSAKRKVVMALSVIGTSILAALAWYAIIKLKHYETDYSNTLQIAKIDQIGQLKYVLKHPFAFAKTLFRTFVYGSATQLPDFFWTSMYGFFSLFTYHLPLPFIGLGYAVLLIAYLYSANVKNDAKITARMTLVQSIVFILSTIAVAGALYMVWTPVGAPEVAGIQGRYFIPLLPLLIPLAVYAGRWVKLTFDKPYRMGALLSMVSVINLTAMVALTLKYYP